MSRRGFWIIDTGASNHMCHDITLLMDVEALDPRLPFFLPDGGARWVHQVGKGTLPGNIFLHHVLYLPTFKFNLLSVNHLCKTTNVCFTFSSSICCLQDLKTKGTLAVGNAMGALYVLDHTSFHNSSSSLAKSNVDDALSSCNVFASFNNKDQHMLLWHKRFGHASISTLKHIPILSNNMSFVLHSYEICPLAKQPQTTFSP